MSVSRSTGCANAPSVSAQSLDIAASAALSCPRPAYTDRQSACQVPSGILSRMYVSHTSGMPMSLPRPWPLYSAPKSRRPSHPSAHRNHPRSTTSPVLSPTFRPYTGSCTFLVGCRVPVLARSSRLSPSPSSFWQTPCYPSLFPSDILQNTGTDAYRHRSTMFPAIVSPSPLSFAHRRLSSYASTPAPCFPPSVPFSYQPASPQLPPTPFPA